MIVTTNMLKEKYFDYVNPLDKIKRDTGKGIIFRLTKGIYETNRNVSPFLLASSILSPSYLSFDFALSYYNLIPEKVFAITSATLNNHKNKTFENIFGRYEYQDISFNAFSNGVTYIESEGYTVKIATKEKTICDCLSKRRVVKNINELKEFLFIDKRIDESEFKLCDFKLIRKEYDYE